MIDQRLDFLPAELGPQLLQKARHVFLLSNGGKTLVISTVATTEVFRLKRFDDMETQIMVTRETGRVVWSARITILIIVLLALTVSAQLHSGSVVEAAQAKSESPERGILQLKVTDRADAKFSAVIQVNESRYKFTSPQDALVAFEEVLSVIRLGKGLKIQLADLIAVEPGSNGPEVELGIELARRASEAGSSRSNRGRIEPYDELMRKHYDLFLPLATERATLQEKYGPEHPQVQVVRRRIEVMKELLEEMAGQGQGERQMLTPRQRIWLDMLGLDQQERINLLRAYIHTRLADLSGKSERA